jgi:hypothetical protein
MKSIAEIRAMHAQRARDAASNPKPTTPGTVSKESWTTKFPKIPPTILALLQKPPLLKGESVQEYNELFGALVVGLMPVDVIEWLWILNYLDSIWEVFRSRRFISVLITLEGKRALEAVIGKTLPIDKEYYRSDQAKAEALWSADPAYFAKHGIDPLSVLAMAAVQLQDNLEALYKRLQQAERRCDAIMQQLEYRREVFAHRAHRVAEELLHDPGHAAADPAPALVDQTTPDSIAAGDASVITEPSATDVGSPSLEETSAETSGTGSSPLTDQATENQVGDDAATVPTDPAVATDRVSSEEASA